VARKDDPDRFLPKSFLKRLDESHEARARLLHVEKVLESDRVREWLRGEEVDEAKTIRSLRDRRLELMERVARSDEDAEKRRPSLEDATGPTVSISRRPLTGIRDLDFRYPFGCAPSEGSVPVPLPLEGPSVVPPPGDNAGGAIVTLHTADPWEAPEPHHVASLRKSFTLFSFDQSFWLKNWRWVIPFPCAPCDSRLSYRVYVETGGLFGANAFGVGLWNWINVRELPDVTGGIDFGSIPDYEVWPIDRSWPLTASFMFESIWAGVTLEGTLSVKNGQSPVVAILMGAMVAMAFGQFRILNSGFHPWEMQRFPPGGYPQPQDFPFHARVHYRYEPIGPVISP